MNDQMIIVAYLTTEYEGLSCNGFGYVCKIKIINQQNLIIGQQSFAKDLKILILQISGINRKKTHQQMKKTQNHNQLETKKIKLKVP